jgi:hypothetical protein
MISNFREDEKTICNIEISRIRFEASQLLNAFRVHVKAFFITEKMGTPSFIDQEKSKFVSNSIYDLVYRIVNKYFLMKKGVISRHQI